SAREPGAWSLRAGPGVECVGDLFFISGTVTELDKAEAALLVETARLAVLLEDMEPQTLRGSRLGMREQSIADAAAMPGGQHIEMFQHAVMDGSEADDLPVEHSDSDGALP